MIVGSIEYSSTFVHQLKKLPRNIILKTEKIELIFRTNPLHPSLRLHELHGKFQGFWSISISHQYRIVFERMSSGDIVFISIGSHDIYRSL